MNNNFHAGNTQFPHSTSGQASYSYNSSYNVLNPQISQGTSLTPPSTYSYGVSAQGATYCVPGPTLNSAQDSNRNSNHSMPATVPQQYHNQQSLSSAQYSNYSMPSATTPQQYHNQQTLSSVQHSNQAMPATTPQQYHNHQSLSSLQHSNHSMPATTPQQYHNHQSPSSVQHSNHSTSATTSQQYYNNQSLSGGQFSHYSMSATIPQQYNNFAQPAQVTQQPWPNFGNTSSVQCSQSLSGNTSMHSGNSTVGYINSSGNNLVAGMNAISVSEFIKNYIRIVKDYQGPVCACPICLCDCDLNDEEVVVALLRCDHQMHLQCLNDMLKNQPNNQFMKCPVCKVIIYGEETGNQPPGVMNAVTINQSLPGYPNVKTIQITYAISSGTQGPEHPNPGKRYHAHGFPRTCYLPDTEKGRLVLHLLNVAFRRRLIFTVGRSATTNHDNSVVWNDIHHKTSMSGGGYGYPDPSYLDRCLEELAAHGVTHSGPIPDV